MGNLTIDGRNLTEGERMRYLADDEAGIEARQDMAIELGDLLHKMKLERDGIIATRLILLEREATYAAHDLRVRELQRAMGMPQDGAGWKP